MMILCFSPLDIFFPEERTIGGFCYLAGFIIFALFFGYRAYFHSDEWFRVREEKWKLWWGKHPRLEVAAGIMGWVAFIAYSTYKFISDFYKH
jgi:hypothetical protein